MGIGNEDTVALIVKRAVAERWLHDLTVPQEIRDAAAQGLGAILNPQPNEPQEEPHP